MNELEKMSDQELLERVRKNEAARPGTKEALALMWFDALELAKRLKESSGALDEIRKVARLAQLAVPKLSKNNAIDVAVATLVEIENRASRKAGRAG